MMQFRPVPLFSALCAAAAVVALGSSAVAEPPEADPNATTERAPAEAATAEAATDTATDTEATESEPAEESAPQRAAASDAAPLRLDADAAPSPERRQTVIDWTRQLTHRLSLREFIRTTPVVVGGVTVYVEAEAVAQRQRPSNTSQLTLAFAPDRVVVLGAF